MSVLYLILKIANAHVHVQQIVRLINDSFISSHGANLLSNYLNETSHSYYGDTYTGRLKKTGPCFISLSFGNL